jgi:hypothetical protein
MRDTIKLRGNQGEWVENMLRNQTKSVNLGIKTRVRVEVEKLGN